MMSKNEFGNNTKCVHAGTYLDKKSLGINTPIFASTAHIFPNDQDLVKYPRYGNILTQEAVAEKITLLEGGEAGHVFSSGMAAITTVLFAFLKKGDHGIFQSGLYGGTQKFINSEFKRYNIKKDIIYSNNPEDYVNKIKKNTKLIYIESPTNPLLDIVDLKELSKLAREHGVLTIVDNTFATPINQNPFKLGIDIVIHSGTKYLNGHSDLSCGAVVTSNDLIETIRDIALIHGGCLDTFACYLLERGLKTLGLRVTEHNKNALMVAEFLSRQELVERVYYPGLSTHPGHEIAKKQMSGFGGMVSFELANNSKLTRNFVSNLRLITPAVSLGGLETILCFPAETSHAKISSEERKRQGISDSLIRLSVGIEECSDLIADLEKAFMIER